MGILTERQLDQASGHYELTHAQDEVCRLLVTTKLAEKSIARRIGKTTHTTHSHIREVYRKCGVRSRLDLVILINGHFPNPDPEDELSDELKMT